jgi:GNAT superfamily N-acetyltransferase
VKRFVTTAWRTLAGLTRPSQRGNLRRLRRLRRRGEALSDLRIREATPADIPKLARHHVVTWNATYAPFGERGPSVEVRERQWREKFGRDDPRWFCLVVQRADGELVGFAQANRSENPSYDGELAKIHLRKDYQRLGLGRRLVGRVARRFLSHGIRSMWLQGDARNPSTRAWIAMGATKCDDDPSSGSHAWSDITPLARFPE